MNRAVLRYCLVLILMMSGQTPLLAQAKLAPEIAAHFFAEPDGRMTHKATGFSFPARVGILSREPVRIHRADGSDVSATYAGAGPDGRKYHSELFVFKARTDADCKMLDKARACLAKANPATIIFSEGPYRPAGRTDIRGFKGIYRGKLGVGGEAVIIHYVDLGDWIVKLVSIMQSSDGKSQVSVDELKAPDAFIDSLPWDKLRAKDAICNGKACDTAHAYPLRDFGLGALVDAWLAENAEKPKTEKQLLKELTVVSEVTPTFTQPVKLFADGRPVAQRKAKNGQQKIAATLVYRAVTILGELRYYKLDSDTFAELGLKMPSHMSWTGPISFFSLHGDPGPLPLRLYDGVLSQADMEARLKTIMLADLSGAAPNQVLKETLTTPLQPGD